MNLKMSRMDDAREANNEKRSEANLDACAFIDLFQSAMFLR